MKIIYLTAGAAGMFCGSCMHDNTLARAMGALGHDVQLVPLYTPIRTDEISYAKNMIFFGGINVYLQQKMSLFRHLPHWLLKPLDQPWLLNWAAQRSVKIQAAELGSLTVAMLQGREGPLKHETDRLVDWIAEERPDVVDFTNILVAASAPAIRDRVPCKLVVTLQGDDIFLQDLLPEFRSQALELIRRSAAAVDTFLVNSVYYADHMAKFLQLPREKFRVVPLGLDTSDFEKIWAEHSAPANIAERAQRPPTIGYLARLAPEKGLHVLADAFVLLRKELGCQDARLRIAGWLGKEHQPYAEKIFAKLRSSGVGDAVDHVPDLDRRGKVDFLRSIDVLSVPTVYREPKGLFVLEALSLGVPVVQPNHGAFPEMIDDLQGGKLVAPENPRELADALATLIREPDQRRQLGEQGRSNLLARRNARAMAEATLEAIGS